MPILQEFMKQVHISKYRIYLSDYALTYDETTFSPYTTQYRLGYFFLRVFKGD